MVAKNDLLTAIQAIKEALLGFVPSPTSDKVHVFESEWGHIRALVGSDGFIGMSIGERQESVWKHLRKNVEPEHLVYLYGVHPMDFDEWKMYTHEASQGGFE